MNDAIISDFAASVQAPAWRYRRALDAALDRRVLLPSVAGKATRDLAQYLRREQACQTEDERRRLLQHNWAKATALKIYREPDRERASFLEALILARESNSAIANRADLSKNTINWYARCFFDVRPMLDDVDYVVNHAIRPELNQGADKDQAIRNCVLKNIGYFCGPDVLLQLLPVGKVDPLNLWTDPLSHARRVAATGELCQLFGRLFGQAESQGKSGSAGPFEDLHKLVEKLELAIGKLHLGPAARNVLERQTKQILERIGSAGGDPRTGPATFPPANPMRARSG